ncbi:MAG: GGDEF domain-containing protein [Lachnospiraceae bacterium]|nr:GGDEF domain-containing protein [Lachnospiraceae bacterium]
MTSLIVLEVILMVLSFFKQGMYGEYMLVHRIQYVIMFISAFSYMLVILSYKKAPEKKVGQMKVINPLYAAIFMAWSIFLTYNEMLSGGGFDTSVYLAISLALPICFFLSDFEYMLITLICDVVMIISFFKINNNFAGMINFIVIIVLRIIMCIAFFRLRYRLASRVIEEKRNADIDVMTGFFSRRYYENDLRELSALDSEWIYVSVDINGLKEVNDQFGHESGDQLIKGAAECMKQTFGNYGKYYRIGGDEFAMALLIDQNEFHKLIDQFETSMKTWSQNHHMILSMSYGSVSNLERSGSGIHEMIQLADQRMYASKAEYYRKTGMERRQNLFAKDNFNE